MDAAWIEKQNLELKKKSPVGIIEWALEEFGEDIAMTTSFGYTGTLMLYQILKFRPEIAIYFIDTGYHFKESLDFARSLQEKWKLNLQWVKPIVKQEDLVNKIGDPPYEINPDQCCKINKVDPLLSFIHTKKAWFSGIRRDQAITRKNLNVIALDKHGALKVHPYVYWTRQEVWDFIRKNNIPYNPLHDKHYTSVGCAPCTIPTKPGSHERDGRWPHFQKLECGINDFNSNDAESTNS